MTGKIYTLLKETTERALRALDIPETALHDEISRSGFVFPFAFLDEERRLERYYGNCYMGRLEGGKRMAVINRTSAAHRRDSYLDDIRNGVTNCVWSIGEREWDFSTLSLNLRQVYFCAENHMLSSQITSGNFPGHTRVYSGNFELYNDGKKLAISTFNYKWENVDGLLNLLSNNGVEKISREPIKSCIRLGFDKSSSTHRKLSDDRIIPIGRILDLDRETLTVKKWASEDCRRMTYYFMHALPSSMDVILAAHSERQISVEDLVRRMPNVDPVLTQPCLNGILIRKYGQYRITTPHTGITTLHEYEQGERINLQYRNVSFHVINQRIKRYSFVWNTGESKPAGEQLLEPRLIFSCAETRSQLIEAVTHLTDILLKAKDNKQMATETAMFYFPASREGEIQMTSLEVQAVLRLHDGDSNLMSILGLDSSPSLQVLQNKVAWLRSVLERCKKYGIMKRLDLNNKFLQNKLRSAVTKAGIKMN